jgi:hypothetical protein
MAVVARAGVKGLRRPASGFHDPGIATRFFMLVCVLSRMATSSDPTAGTSLVQTPTTPVGYVAILAALVTGVIHLFLGPQVMGFSQQLGVLFILNGLGFLGGIAVYLSRYWRRELYLVAAGYALVTIVALFAFQGFGADAFYRQGSLNPLAVGAKAAELVLAVCAVYLYTAAE